METLRQTLFWGGSKITADGDCSHESKRDLLLGRKTLTNLDSILKSRDVTLPTKVCLVKAMVFPVVMYRCKSWTIKKADCQRIDPFELWCWWTLESPLDCKEIQPVHPKGDQSWIFIGRTDAEAEFQNFGHLMWRTDSLEKTLMLGKIEGSRRRGQQRMKWMASLTQWAWVWVGFKSWWWTKKPGVLYSPWGHKESDTTEWLNWTESVWTFAMFSYSSLCIEYVESWIGFLSSVLEREGKGSDYRSIVLKTFAIRKLLYP